MSNTHALPVSLWAAQFSNRSSHSYTSYCTLHTRFLGVWQNTSTWLDCLQATAKKHMWCHVVISTRCGDFCGDLHHRSKSPHVLLAVLTTSPNHHKSLSRFSPHVKIATCICGDLAQGLAGTRSTVSCLPYCNMRHCIIIII